MKTVPVVAALLAVSSAVAAARSVSSPRAAVVAAGASCRAQIRDGTGVAPLHPVQALAQALGLVGPGDVLLAAGSLFVAGAVFEEWPKIREKFLSGKPVKSGFPEAD